LSVRAAAQLELLGFANVQHYFKGKADWIVRGLPSEPAPTIAERARALRYFINNLVPGLRSSWIQITGRAQVKSDARDDLERLGPEDQISRAAPDHQSPRAVVLDSSGVLLGAIDKLDAQGRARDVMNPAPQTIRPDMPPALAAKLLKSNPYLIVTTEFGKYVGHYDPATN
jgi:hypothetical protein